MIESSKQTISNISGSSISVEGQFALLATREHNANIARSVHSLMTGIKQYEVKLVKLRSQYYDYVLRCNIELKFSNKVYGIFDRYQENVDKELVALSKSAVNKLSAIEDSINSDNPESFSQILMTCRRLFQDVSDLLFERYFPNYSGKTYMTKSNKEINIDGDHYLNKLSAVIEFLQNKSASKTLIGSSVIKTIDWIENLNDLPCKGVHSQITKEEALRCIIHTYICLGDILHAQKQ